MITDINWKMVASCGGTKEHGLMYKSNYKGYVITCEIVTQKKCTGEFGKEKRTFYADYFRDMFKTLEELKQFIDNLILSYQDKERETPCK